MMFYRMSMLPPHMAMMSGGPPKPLFPSAVPTSSPGAPVVGADFKPINSGTIAPFFSKLFKLF